MWLDLLCLPVILVVGILFLRLVGFAFCLLLFLVGCFAFIWVYCFVGFVIGCLPYVAIWVGLVVCFMFVTCGCLLGCWFEFRWPF